ncbi:hypothetical protein N7520_002099 [Penicillium odoratum]|uniref:uncharacterized protein n=1 Tax=Penicillium odoratum TaxID=1167516 RepID=UPI002548708E|nr:uncharacterized protein N7520_002099 [Penicillium odoratum]KAJ5771570.1 hypothetical protein N7520_002099 [Penicillium odoratum]
MLSNQGQADALPPYDLSEDFDYAFDTKSMENLLLPEQADEPGFAVASTLTRGLQVPSRSGTCSSGFDYPEELSQHRISEKQWSQFNQVICDEAKLSPQQWSTVIGKGLGILAMGGLMIGFFGAIPAVLIARHIRRKKENRNLATAMAGEQGERLAHHISVWNETFFKPRGLLIRVDLPKELLEDMKEMDLHLEGSVTPSDSKSRDKAALKARIVIIPLDGSASTSRRGSETTLRAE